jgi:PncC family amidohydrolase
MLIESISEHLLARGWHLAVAESATGGLMGHMITKVPGSSRYFLGGVIAYANEVKQGALGVQEESLRRWGAVSAPVAMEMAAGARRLTGADVALSTSGIAGPTGATATKPIGLYYIGLATPDERWCWRHVFGEDRHDNNERAAHAAFEHLLMILNGTGR